VKENEDDLIEVKTRHLTNYMDSIVQYR